MLKTVYNGGVNIKKIDYVDNVVAYMVKHMTKSSIYVRIFSKKAYSCSRNLEKPQELYGAQAEYLYQKMLEEERKEVYSYQYENNQTFKLVYYKEYNFNRNYSRSNK
ncbi:hypothetical protein D1B33_05425 [Lysinibacillus yapensis]|uniref:Uncharacterized protein n=1 Tax=Ureibacillus yapensis TaxID=2304605 RepID=A0A396SGX4_9BACL|nr:hypothetical protein D1B33_05425 [Lysinibacillus yapensis]